MLPVPSFPSSIPSHVSHIPFILSLFPSLPPPPSAVLVYPKTNRLLAFDGRLLHGVVPGRRAGGRTGGREDGRRRVTFMVGFWEDDDSDGDDDDNDNDDYEEEVDVEEEEGWEPGPMQEVPLASVALTWPGLLGEVKDWEVGGMEGGREEGGGGGTMDGVVVLPKGAWTDMRPRGGEGGKEEGKEGKKHQARQGADEEGEDEDEDEDEREKVYSFSPKATYRFLLRCSREIEDEMEALAVEGEDGEEDEVVR